MKTLSYIQRKRISMYIGLAEGLLAICIVHRPSLSTDSPAKRACFHYLCRLIRRYDWRRLCNFPAHTQAAAQSATLAPIRNSKHGRTQSVYFRTSCPSLFLGQHCFPLHRSFLLSLFQHDTILLPLRTNHCDDCTLSALQLYLPQNIFLK